MKWFLYLLVLVSLLSIDAFSGVNPGSANSAIFASTSLGATVSSSPIEVGGAVRAGIQLQWTGTPAGNFTVEESCDDLSNGSTTVPTHWDTVSGSTVAAGGAAGTTLYDLSSIGCNWIRVTFTRSSSTGTVTGRINYKNY